MVGMVLVLGISVVGIVAVLYWGVPTIADMKSDAEFQAVTNQFNDLDGNVDELTRGTPGETAKRWQPAFERGAVDYDGDRERWIVLADVGGDADQNWTLSDLYDGDNNFTVHNHHNGGDTETIVVEAWTVDAGATEPVTVSDSDDCSDTTTTTEMTAAAVAAGSSVYLCLYHDDDSMVDVDEETLKFRITEEPSGVDEVRAEAYLVDVGSIHYIMTMGPSQRDAYHTNGAVIKGDPQSLEVDSAPPFGPPRSAGDSLRFFGRLVELQGEASFGGTEAERFRVLMSLYSTDVLADLGETRALKVWIDGDTTDAWYDHFTEGGADQEFKGISAADEPDGIEWRPGNDFTLKIVHSIVQLRMN